MIASDSSRTFRWGLAFSAAMHALVLVWGNNVNNPQRLLADMQKRSEAITATRAPVPHNPAHSPQ